MPMVENTQTENGSLTQAQQRRLINHFDRDLHPERKALEELAASPELALIFGLANEMYFGLQDGRYIIAPVDNESSIGWSFQPNSAMFRREKKPRAWPTGTTDGDVTGIVVSAKDRNYVFSLHRTKDSLPSIDGLHKIHISTYEMARYARR